MSKIHVICVRFNRGIYLVDESELERLKQVCSFLDLLTQDDVTIHIAECNDGVEIRGRELTRSIIETIRSDPELRILYRALSSTPWYDRTLSDLVGLLREDFGFDEKSARKLVWSLVKKRLLVCYDFPVRTPLGDIMYYDKVCKTTRKGEEYLMKQAIEKTVKRLS